MSEKRENQYKALLDSLKNQGGLKLTTGRQLAQEQEKKRDRRRSRDLFELYAPQVEASLKDSGRQHVRLVPRLFAVSFRGGARCWLEFKVGIDRLYVLKDPLSFREAVRFKQPWPLGKNNAIDTKNFCWADGISERLFNLIDEARKKEWELMEQGRHYYGFGAYSHSMLFEEKRFKLSQEEFCKFLDIMEGAAFELNMDDSLSEEVQTAPGNPPLKIEMQREEDGGG